LVNWNITENSFKTFTPKASHLSLGLDEVILDKDTQDELDDIITFYKNKDFLEDKWGLKRYCHGNGVALNFYGPSGTGKTHTARALSNALGLEFIEASYHEIESKYVGDTSKNLTAIFGQATKNNQMLIFNEADALLSKRRLNTDQSTDNGVNLNRSTLL